MMKRECMRSCLEALYDLEHAYRQLADEFRRLISENASDERIEERATED